ncbi:hypothetical protein V8E36_003923 [Tilletia maclaganii]
MAERALLLTEMVLLRFACVVLGGRDRSSVDDGQRSGGKRAMKMWGQKCGRGSITVRSSVQNPVGFRNASMAGARAGGCCGCEMAELLGGEAVRMHEEAERLKQ